MKQVESNCHLLKLMAKLYEDGIIDLEGVAVNTGTNVIHNLSGESMKYRFWSDYTGQLGNSNFQLAWVKISII